MEFYQYLTTRDQMKDLVDVPAKAFYERNFAFAVGPLNSKAYAVQMRNELGWEDARRPYYNVFPAIAPMLLRLNLEVDTSLIRLPLPIFCIRFPTDHSPLQFQWSGENWQVRSMLVGPTNLQHNSEVFEGLIFWVDIGETEIMPNGRKLASHSYINLPVTQGMTLEESLKALPYDPSAFHGVVMPEEIRTACAKLACTICLIGDNPEIIEPDVLSKDRDKYDHTHDPKYAEKAKRRGKFGFNVGKGIEVIPHVRRPHPALMWTGHGREVARIVMRKGSVVHREVVEHIPTGFQDD